MCLLWILLVGHHLHQITAFVITSDHDTTLYSTTNMCKESSRRQNISEISSSSEWYHVPRNSLLHKHDEDAKQIMRGCDAIVTTLNINDNKLQPGIWARTFHPQSTNELHALTQQDGMSSSTSVPIEAIEAIEITHRWSSNFVRQLALCPWAGSSLDTLGAIRYWVLLVHHDEDTPVIRKSQYNKNAAIFERMEDVIREASEHLKQITSRTSRDDNGIDRVDPSVAISFVILVDTTTPTSSEPTSPSQQVTSTQLLPDFSSFYQFSLNLEDRLLDECDEYCDEIDDQQSDVKDGIIDDNVPLGCEITTAAFHPHWQFGKDNEKDDNTVQPIDYEKRTPYPTISCVMTSAIDVLMNESTNSDNSVREEHTDGFLPSAPVTERIAALNEKTLNGIGIQRLKELFITEVLQCPMKKKSLDE